MKKIAKIFFLLIILAGTAVICILRWDAWFSNPAEPTYFVDDEPHNVVLTMGANYNERAFSWRTSTLLPSFVVLDNADTIPADGKLIASRSGEAAYYNAYSPSLAEGQHTYFIQSGDYKTDVYNFNIANSDTVHFLLFGDIQATSVDSFLYTIHHTPYTAIAIHSDSDTPDFIAYVGDMIERPTDEYWQVWFSSIGDAAASVPQIACVGNHEYLKGIHKTIDPRWTTVFSNPKNGPYRFLGTSYYVDFPEMRYIVLNTQGCELLSDYTISATWLTDVLKTAGDKWKIVVMHHPVHASAMKRNNPMVYAMFHQILRKADLVIAGHDHNYARRTHVTFIDELLGNEQTTPVYLVTSSANKYYLPKCSEKDQRIGSNRRFYEKIWVTADELRVETHLFPSADSITSTTTVSVPVPELVEGKPVEGKLAEGETSNTSISKPVEGLYDAFSITRETRVVTVSDNLMPEILEMPERYLHKHNVASVATSRSRNRMAARQKRND